MNKILLKLAAVALLVPMVAGCGALRSLTTKSINFGPYYVADQNVSSPVGGTLVATGSFDITGDVAHKYDKYHGGIDWAGFSYNAALLSGSEVQIDLYASTESPVGEFPNIQVPVGATLVESIQLTSGTPNVIKDADTNHNEALRSFIADTLREANGQEVRAYVYFKVTSPTAGSLSVTGISVKGKAHGSLF